MREPERIDRIMTLIHQIWEKYPDTRFFQLVEAFRSEFGIHKDEAFNFEDSKLEEYLIEYWKDLNKL